MAEKRHRPTPSVHLIGVSVSRKLIVVTKKFTYLQSRLRFENLDLRSGALFRASDPSIVIVSVLIQSIPDICTISYDVWTSVKDTSDMWAGDTFSREIARIMNCNETKNWLISFQRPQTCISALFQNNNAKRQNNKKMSYLVAFQKSISLEPLGTI